MADGKKSFLLYTDLIHTFEELTDEEAGQLIKHLLAYVNDRNPETYNRVVKIAFEPIKQQLKRDLKHWESIKEKKSAAGKASAYARQQKSTPVESVEQNPTDSTVNVNVNVNVSVTDIILTDIDIGGTIQFIQLTSQRLLTEKKILDYWAAFQIHAKDDFPKKRTDWIQHFRNWLKKQPNEQRAKTPVRTITQPSGAKDYGTA